MEQQGVGSALLPTAKAFAKYANFETEYQQLRRIATAATV